MRSLLPRRGRRKKVHAVKGGKEGSRGGGKDTGATDLPEKKSSLAYCT